MSCYIHGDGTCDLKIHAVVVWGGGNLYNLDEIESEMIFYKIMKKNFSNLFSTWEKCVSLNCGNFCRTTHRLSVWLCRPSVRVFQHSMKMSKLSVCLLRLFVYVPGPFVSLCKPFAYLSKTFFCQVSYCLSMCLDRKSKSIKKNVLLSRPSVEVSTHSI